MPGDRFAVRERAARLRVEIDERAQVFRQYDAPVHLDVVPFSHDIDVRASQLEAALPRAEIEDVEGGVGDREMAAREPVERECRGRGVGTLQRRRRRGCVRLQ